MPKEHLDFDLDSLDSDKTDTPKVQPHHKKETFPSRRGLFESSTASENHDSTPKPPKKKIGRAKLIVGAVCGVILLMLIIIAANTPETNYNTGVTAPINNTPVINTAAQNSQADPLDLFTDGNGATYSCSLSDHATATSLHPAVSDKSKIATDENYINTLNTKIENEKAEIDSSYVDDNSPQYEINQYNSQVDQYNADLQTYKRAAANYDQEIDSYNAKVDTYNNFLRNNCTLQQ